LERNSIGEIDLNDPGFRELAIIHEDLECAEPYKKIPILDMVILYVRKFFKDKPKIKSANGH